MTSSAELGPDAATELRLIRAEITAIRQQVIREQVARERAHVPPAPVPHQHYRVMASLRRRLHRRSVAQPGLRHINRQRHRSLLLLLFGVIRIIAWTILAILIGCGLLGVAGFDWARTLAESLPFVVMISIYANWATDVDGATAAFAALVASDSHAAVVATGVTLEADLDALKADVDRLAGLQPGVEASELADGIRGRLQAASGRP